MAHEFSFELSDKEMMDLLALGELPASANARMKRVAYNKFVGAEPENPDFFITASYQSSQGFTADELASVVWPDRPGSGEDLTIADIQGFMQSSSSSVKEFVEDWSLDAADEEWIIKVSEA